MKYSQPNKSNNTISIKQKSNPYWWQFLIMTTSSCHYIFFSIWTNFLIPTKLILCMYVEMFFVTWNQRSSTYLISLQRTLIKCNMSECVCTNNVATDLIEDNEIISSQPDYLLEWLWTSEFCSLVSMNQEFPVETTWVSLQLPSNLLLHKSLHPLACQSLCGTSPQSLCCH